MGSSQCRSAVGPAEPYLGTVDIWTRVFGTIRGGMLREDVMRKTFIVLVELQEGLKGLRATFATTRLGCQVHARGTTNVDPGLQSLRLPRIGR
jgi:hypothetical protein